MMPSDSRVVYAVGVLSISRDRALSRRVEAAMAQAVRDAAREGVTTAPEHADALRARMMAARQAVTGGDPDRRVAQ